MRIALVAVLLALAAPAAATAQTYPDPKEPGKVQAPPKRSTQDPHGVQEGL